MLTELNSIKKLSLHLEGKANLKQDIYTNTFNALSLIKKEAEFMVKDMRSSMMNRKRVIPLEINDRSDFEFEMKFGGDVLIFFMHSNVFDLGIHHEQMRTHYLREEPNRRFCGIIHIYNFLADSFKYQRMNDSGILIGRVFINIDNHFFIEGRREMNQVGISFESDKISSAKIRKMLMASILHTINFDLPSPPFEAIQEVNVMDFASTLDQMQMKTSKKLGFKFKAEEGNIF